MLRSVSRKLRASGCSQPVQLQSPSGVGWFNNTGSASSGGGCPCGAGGFALDHLRPHVVEVTTTTGIPAWPTIARYVEWPGSALDRWA